MKPRSAETAEIVMKFKAGASMQQLAIRNGWALAKVERAIRRWLVRYPEGKP